MTLEQYLTENGIRPSTFAGRIGVAPSTITRLIRRERSPRLDLVRLIREETGGLVTAEDFMTAPSASNHCEDDAETTSRPVPSAEIAAHEGVGQ